MSRVLFFAASAVLAGAAIDCNGSSDDGSGAGSTTSTSSGAPGVPGGGSSGVVAEPGSPGGDPGGMPMPGSSTAGTPGGSPGGIDSGVPATPAVRYVGRFDTSGTGGPRAGYPAARAIVRFEGTALEATLTTTNANANTSYYDVVVDGVLSPTLLALHDGTANPTLATGLAAGTHTVELVKRNEASYGVTQFAGFRYPNGGRLLAPAPAPTRRIEAVGTSYVMGYGVDGMGPSCPGGAPSETHDAKKSVGYLAATELNADFAFVGASNKGVLVNGDTSDTVTLPVLFERPQPFVTTPWSHATNQPDAWVLFSSNLDIPNITDAALDTAYENFVKRARAVYPSAHIFIVVSSMASDTFPHNAQTRTRLEALGNEIVRRRALVGDNKVYAYSMTRYEDAQLTGCFYQPNADLNRQMANQLTGWIRTRLGW